MTSKHLLCAVVALSTACAAHAAMAEPSSQTAAAAAAPRLAMSHGYHGDQPKTADGLMIHGAWSRASAGRAPNGAAYFTVTNRGTAADRLLSASARVAKRTELHTHKKDNGIMRMRRVDSVAIAPGETVSFKPGGYHVMLFGLHKPLKAGQSFPLTLRFEKAGERRVTVLVKGIGASGHGHHSPGHHSHGKALMLPAGHHAPTVKLAITKDAAGGWNLRLRVTNFRFAPEHASGPHRAGEGHGHLLVNGKKLARLYGQWFHIASLPPGKAEIRVTLNTNDHRTIMVGGKRVEARRIVTVATPKH